MALNSPNIEKLYNPNPKIIEGSLAVRNPEKDGISDLLVSQQIKLNEIEKDFGTGGNLIENIVRNKHTVIGATTNSTPQGIVIPEGKRITGAVAVTPKGVASLDAGVPIVQEVDNWSTFPCGNYNVDVGNRYSVKTGGGGVHFVSSGGASLISETVTKVGSNTQTLIGGETVNVNGNTNVTIEGGLVNLKSDAQVVVDSTLGVSGNVIVQGGIYSEGELFVNHITGPREIQQTVVGFTGEGAEGQLVFGNWISGVAVIGGQAANALGQTALNAELAALQSKYKVLTAPAGTPAPSQWPYFPDYVQTPPLPSPPLYTTIPAFDGNVPGTAFPIAAGIKIVPIKIFLGIQGNNAVELLPHGHEFPSIPMNLIESNSSSVNNKMRQYAISRGINRPDFSVNSENLTNLPKYNKPGFVKAIVQRIISALLNFPGNSKGYSVTGG